MDATPYRLMLPPEAVGRLVGVILPQVNLSPATCPKTLHPYLTGAVVPPGSTCVVLQENTKTEGNAIILTQDVAVGANIRYGGEEVAAGDTVLTAGRILRPADVMLLAAIGIGQVPVYRKIKVAVLSTGDELNEPGTPATDNGQVTTAIATP